SAALPLGGRLSGPGGRSSRPPRRGGREVGGGRPSPPPPIVDRVASSPPLGSGAAAALMGGTGGRAPQSHEAEGACGGDLASWECKALGEIVETRGAVSVDSQPGGGELGNSDVDRGRASPPLSESKRACAGRRGAGVSPPSATGHRGGGRRPSLPSCVWSRRIPGVVSL